MFPFLLVMQLELMSSDFSLWFLLRLTIFLLNLCGCSVFLRAWQISS